MSGREHESERLLALNCPVAFNSERLIRKRVIPFRVIFLCHVQIEARRGTARHGKARQEEHICII